MDTTDGFHSYRVKKVFDTVNLYIDGRDNLVLSLPYEDLYSTNYSYSHIRLAASSCAGTSNFDVQGFTFSTQDDPTIITLDYFTATEQCDSIVLKWETLSELDYAGFHIWRSESENEGYTGITESLICAKGDIISNAEYSYIDNTIMPGVRYF